MTIVSTLRHWATGIRFYVAVAIIVISLQVWWWGTTVYGGSNLATIRIQESYAWLSVVFLVASLLIGPAMKLLPKLPGKPLYWEARRMVGIGATWFAFLHAGIVYVVQFQAVNPRDWPASYQRSALLGTVALVILLTLAFTSVNRVMKAWGIWWFRVHRLVYVAVLAAVLHAMTVGTHATGGLALGLLGGAAALWVGLHLYVLVRNPAARTPLRLTTIVLGVLSLVAVLVYGLMQGPR